MIIIAVLAVVIAFLVVALRWFGRSNVEYYPEVRWVSGRVILHATVENP
jgi:hypothetical protein